MEKQIKRGVPEPRKLRHDVRSLARLDLNGIRALTDPVARQKQLNQLLVLAIQDAVANPKSAYAVWLVDQALAHGADPNTQRGDPLIIAVEKERPELVKILLERGAAVAWDDYIVIDTAVACEASNEILVALLEYGAWPIDCQEELSELARRRNNRKLNELVELALDRLSLPRFGSWRKKDPPVKMGEDFTCPADMSVLDPGPPDPFEHETRIARRPSAEPGPGPEPVKQLEVPRAPAEPVQMVKVPGSCVKKRIVALSHDFRAPGSNQARVYRVIQAAGNRGLTFQQLYELIISQVPSERKPLECARWVFNQYPKRGWGQLVPDPA